MSEGLKKKKGGMGPEQNFIEDDSIFKVSILNILINIYRAKAS
jgi:hypothetical protein